MAGTILYHVVSPVHLRNAEALAPGVEDHELRVVYETGISGLPRDRLAESPLETVPLQDGEEDDLWTQDVGLLVLSHYQPRTPLLRLAASALEHEIPTLVIEETNQIALNSGRVNNCLAPVNLILAASNAERDGLLDHGIPEERIEVTGWPFYHGATTPPARREVREMRSRLGLDPDRPVALLGLTQLDAGGETPEVRRSILDLAARGLPDDVQLAVKPHPIEPLEDVRPFLDAHAPDAVPIDGGVPIEDALTASDLLLNRGVSQVCLEALLMGRPVVVLESGIETPFHRDAPQLVVDDPDSLSPLVEKLIASDTLPEAIYGELLDRHLPHPPGTARENVRDLLARWASDPPSTEGDDQERRYLHLVLALAHAGRPSTSRRLLASGAPGALGQALDRLIGATARREDLDALLATLDDGLGPPMLAALWIRQLHATGQQPSRADLDLLEGWPPRTNTVWYTRDAWRWADVLASAGMSDALDAYQERVADEATYTRALRPLNRALEAAGESPLGPIELRTRAMARRARWWLADRKRRWLG